MAEKREGFRFSNRTINNLKALIEMGLARNKTEAIDFALEHVVTEETTKKNILESMKHQGVKAAGGMQAMIMMDRSAPAHDSVDFLG